MVPAPVVDALPDVVLDDVTLGGPDVPLRVDPVPVVLAADEWEPLAVGLCQRVRALDRFVADVYGRQCIIRDGIVPAAAVASAKYFEPLMQQASHEERPFVTVASADVVRCPDGAFRVLEDHLRTPWGLSYTLAARAAVMAASPPDGQPAPLEPAFAFLARALRAAAPPEVEDPVVALLTDGPHNVAYGDHRRLADLLDLQLVQLGDLRLRGDRLYARVDGRELHIDVVYRRTDEEQLLSARGGLTDVGRLLLQPWIKGTLGLVNAFGTGVADDRLLQAYVEEMVRFYLGEEPLLESVRTWDLLAPGAINRAVEQLDTIVVKPRTATSRGVVVGPLASADGLHRAADGLRASPSEWVVQDYVPGAQRMRPFVFCCEGTTVAVPGGVTHVHGKVKDIWVI